MHTDKNLARMLALVMHAVFITLIVIGVSWQKKPPEPVVADLWSNLPTLPQVKVAPPVEPEDEPEPPKPVPRVKPVPLVPEPVPKAEPKAETKPVAKPDIALQKKPEKEKKAEPKKRDEAEAKRVAEARERDAKRILEEKEADAKAAAEKVAAAERAEKERVAKAAAQATAQAAARDNQRYINGIYARVYARIAVPPDVQGSAEFSVSLLPGGELESVTRVRSSGNAAYDTAVEQAIRQSQPFVVPSGEEFQRSFRRFPMVFRPR